MSVYFVCMKITNVYFCVLSFRYMFFENYRHDDDDDDDDDDARN
jgi:hypothetical protein